jgi:regulator of replication initiation timing
MSVTKGVYDVLKDIAGMSDRVAQLRKDLDRLRTEHGDLRERMARIEVFIELAQQAAASKLTNRD